MGHTGFYSAEDKRRLPLSHQRTGSNQREADQGMLCFQFTVQLVYLLVCLLQLSHLDEVAMGSEERQELEANIDELEDKVTKRALGPMYNALALYNKYHVCVLFNP